MDGQRNVEMELLCGVLEALPCPAALLNRTGEAAYVNSRYCPIVMDNVEFSVLPDVVEVLRGGNKPSHRTRLRAGVKDAIGMLEVYPVKSDDRIIGALLMFRPEFTASELSADALPSESMAMELVWERLQRLRLLNSPVLFLGEEGVGKTEFAQALHRLTAHAKKPFIRLDEKTSISTLYKSAVEAAEGTLYLQSIHKWPENLLDEVSHIVKTKTINSEFGRQIPVLARIMVSAIPNLPKMAETGVFPTELFNRLNIMPAYIPALRERPDDIIPAANQILKFAAQECNKDVQGFTQDALEVLKSYTWPSNLPELKNVITSAVDDCPGGLILASHLSVVHNAAASSSSLHKMRDAYTREHINAMLDVYGHTVEGKKIAAKELGIGLSTLYRILSKR